MLSTLDESFGPGSRPRLAETSRPDEAGARALLETFYYALNNADLDALRATWADDALVELKNPVGGNIQGREAIAALYARVFGSGINLRVTFGDATFFSTPETFLVSGREVGTYDVGGEQVPLTIRTTRVLGLLDDGWRLVHHHGSIDDAGELAAYQRAVRGD